MGRGIPFAGNLFEADLTGASALDFGSSADPFLVGPASEPPGPRWAREREQTFMIRASPGGKRVRIRLGKAIRPPRFLG